MRIADPAPVYCSSCFSQKPHEVHIDFEVAWDGPVISQDGLRLTIDDLICCKTCIVAAASVVGMVDADTDVATELKNVAAKVAEERRARLSAERRVRELEREVAGFEQAQAVFLHAREALESVHLEVNGS